MAVIMARRSGVLVPVLLDDEDAEDLGERQLSVGSHGYAQGFFGGKVEVLHRWVLGLSRGDGLIGDHINGDPLDNRRANLRVVSAGESSANVKHRQISGYRGVHRNHRKWQAKGKLKGKQIYLGTYDTPEEAYEVASTWRKENLPGYVDR